MRPRGRSDRAIFERLQAAEAVAARLRALTDSLGPDFISMRFYVRIRVKGYDSVVKKIYMRRRKRGKELYSLENITDLVGFRIVTLYDDDIKTAIEHLFRLIRMGSSEPLRSDGLDTPLFKPLHDGNATEWDVIREERSGFAMSKRRRKLRPRLKPATQTRLMKKRRPAKATRRSI